MSRVTPLAGAVAILAAWIIGAIFVGGGGEVAMVDTLPVAVYQHDMIAAAATVNVTVPPTTSPTTAAPVGPVAAAAESATRGTQRQVTDTLPPPAPTGLNGQPIAPLGLDRCADMAFYREQAGLPAVFDRVGRLESSCRNDVSSWCCHGHFQIHRLWIRHLAHCGVASIDDLLGDNPLDKQRNACAAAYVYVVQGGEAWDVW